MGVINLSGPVSINLEGVDVPVAPGWHSVKIEKVTVGTTKDEHPRFFVVSRIEDEADPDNNNTLIWNLVFNFTNRSGGFVKRCFAALGMPVQLDYESYELMAEDLIGRECEAYSKLGEYEGVPRAEVGKWRAPSFNDLEL